ncbi:MAG TPA: ATP-binding protein, partial [Solirubrobacteraceae bacterium]
MALTPVRLRVEEASQVAPVRRAAEGVADALGFDETRRGQTAIVATELATNLLRHGQGGEMVVRGAGGTGVDLVAWDRGPGMADASGAERDGVSTAGGPGNGLGAVRRLAASFDVYSAPQQGTVALARMRGDNGSAPAVDGLALAMAGEEASGDAWAAVREDRWVTVVLADGLGHGPEAARAATAALGELRPGVAPEELLRRMHGALRPTRGAAAAVARYDEASGELRFAGIGNIAA